MWEVAFRLLFESYYPALDPTLIEKTERDRKVISLGGRQRAPGEEQLKQARGLILQYSFLLLAFQVP